MPSLEVASSLTISVDVKILPTKRFFAKNNFATDCTNVIVIIIIFSIIYYKIKIFFFIVYRREKI